MARILSFITVVFILVPVIAPALGKFTLDVFNWQAIFYFQLFIALLISIWFWRRQEETLKKEHHRKFKLVLFLDGVKELLKFRRTVGYTLVSGFITGSFIVYLSASQQIFQEQYNLKDAFPFIFASLAISVGFAILLNSSLVLKFGMEKLVTVSLYAYFGISLLYVVLFYGAPNPSAIVLISFFAIQFFAIGFLFGNLRALAMEPVGHIAGIGAAVTGFVSTLMAVPISSYIGKFVETTTLPLFIGFAICSFLSIVIMWVVKMKPGIVDSS